ncbi:MAG: hypothetical protein LBT13_04205 [Treponema sp.]|jgi:hypothetical protein|nr:hypothetical protein [Treponema sp.]
MMEGSKAVEVIPGVTKADIDEMADFVFGRVDGNHPELQHSSNDIIKIFEEGHDLVVQSPAFIKKINL